MPRAPRLGAVAAVLAGSVLLSRVLGYVREAVLARELGASAATDAYYAAFQIPDLLNYFLAGGALSIAFVPYYSRVLAQQGAAAAELLLAKVTGTMGPPVAARRVVASEALRPHSRASLPDEAYVRSRESSSRPRSLHTGGSAAPCVAGASDKGPRAASYKGAIIIGGLRLRPQRRRGLAWGAGRRCRGLAGWRDRRTIVELRMRTWFRFAPFDPQVRAYIAIAIPLMLGLSLSATDEWYDRWFGGLLVAGTVAQLTFARRLMQLPVAVVGQAIATAALPTLSRLWSEGRREQLDAVMRTTLQVGIGLSVIAAGASFVLAVPIVAVVYRRGAFGAEDVAAVALLLQVFSVGVPAWVVQQIGVRAFYARGDTWRPMLLGTFVSLGAIPLYLALGPRYGGAGLAGAGALAMTFNALATLGLARRLHGGPALGPLAASFARACGIAALAALPVMALLRGTEAAAAESTAAALRDLAMGGAVYGAISLFLVFLLGDAPLRDSIRRLARRLRRAPAAPPA